MTLAFGLAMAFLAIIAYQQVKYFALILKELKEIKYTLKDINDKHGK